MAQAKALLAGGLVVLALGIGLAVLALQDDPAGVPGTYAIHVLGPQRPIFTGEVRVDDGTALGALLAAAQEGRFEVRVQGAGDTAFVTSIDGHANRGASGWCYAIERGGTTLHPGVSAAVFGLRPGDAVRWSWGEGGCMHA